MANPWDWGSSSSQSPLSAPVQMAAPASNVMQATPQQEMQAIAPQAPKQSGPIGNAMMAKSLGMGEKAIEKGWGAGAAAMNPAASLTATAAPLTAAETLTPAAFSIAPAATTLAAPLSAAEALTPAAFSLGSAAPAAGLVAAPGALGTAALGAEAGALGAGAGALGTGGAAMAAGLTAMAPVALPALGLYAASQAMKGK